ncbi:MAG TPA: hypothetical protein VJM79_05875 [Rhizorhapis sp.]|nr:hypothetical protein [Rhizorhapis sp.]
MLKFINQRLASRTAQNRVKEQQEKIEGWSLQVGREAAELWVQALSTRDTARLSNA